MGYYYAYCYCNECLNMDLSDINKYDSNECYCSIYHKYINKNDHACSSTNFRYNENLKKSDCYLTTVMCEILNNNDNNYILNTLRMFRDNYLQVNHEFYPILFEYDQIGPIIKRHLLNDSFKHIKSFMMMEIYLKPIVQYIDDGEYEKAINKYKYMVNELKNFYHIEDCCLTNYQINNPKEMGHGYQKKRI